MNNDKIREAFEEWLKKNNHDVDLFAKELSDGYSTDYNYVFEHAIGFYGGYKSAMQSAQEEIERLKCCGNCFYGSGGTDVPWKEVCRLCVDLSDWEVKK